MLAAVRQQVHPSSIRVVKSIFGMDGVERLLGGRPTDIIVTAFPLAAV